jgi:hypothetical protein
MSFRNWPQRSRRRRRVVLEASTPTRPDVASRPSCRDLKFWQRSRPEAGLRRKDPITLASSVVSATAPIAVYDKC